MNKFTDYVFFMRYAKSKTASRLSDPVPMGDRGVISRYNEILSFGAGSCYEYDEVIIYACKASHMVSLKVVDESKLPFDSDSNFIPSDPISIMGETTAKDDNDLAGEEWEYTILGFARNKLVLYNSKYIKNYNLFPGNSFFHNFLFYLLGKDKGRVETYAPPSVRDLSQAPQG